MQKQRRDLRPRPVRVSRHRKSRRASLNARLSGQCPRNAQTRLSRLYHNASHRQMVLRMTMAGRSRRQTRLCRKNITIRRRLIRRTSRRSYPSQSQTQSVFNHRFTILIRYMSSPTKVIVKFRFPVDGTFAHGESAVVNQHVPARPRPEHLVSANPHLFHHN